jgi:ADP-heptose:LPS heptosyltransferase
VFFNMQSRLAASTNTMWERFRYLIYDTIDTDINPDSIRPYIDIPDEIFFTINIFLLKLNIKTKDYIVLNLSAGQERNEWSHDGYKQLVQLIYDDYSNLNVVLVSMPKELELANEITSKYKNRVFLYPITSDVLEIGALIKNSRLVISPDTGIVHFCSALSIPVLGLYQDYKENHITWRPYNVKHKIVQAKKNLYINTVPCEYVYNAFQELMKEI